MNSISSTSDIQSIVDQISATLNKVNPNGCNEVSSQKAWGNHSIRIWITPIKDLPNFMPISLRLWIDDNPSKTSLETQIYGGYGGQCFYRKPRLDCKNERFLAMQSVKIPFRKPKPEMKFILKAIERFVGHYHRLLKENQSELFEKDLKVLTDNKVL